MMFSYLKIVFGCVFSLSTLFYIFCAFGKLHGFVNCFIYFVFLENFLDL